MSSGVMVGFFTTKERAGEGEREEGRRRESCSLKAEVVWTKGETQRKEVARGNLALTGSLSRSSTRRTEFVH